MTDVPDLTPEHLRRENIAAMTSDQLDAEYAAVSAQAQTEARDTYLGYLVAEYRHRGKEPPQ